MIQPSWHTNTLTIRDILHHRTQSMGEKGSKKKRVKDAQKVYNSSDRGDMLRGVFHYPFPITITFTPKVVGNYKSTFQCVTECGTTAEFTCEGQGMQADITSLAIQ
jgi:hypothetical protein